MSTLELMVMLVFEPEQVNEPCWEVISGQERLCSQGQGSNHYVPLRTSVEVGTCFESRSYFLIFKTVLKNNVLFLFYLNSLFCFMFWDRVSLCISPDCACTNNNRLKSWFSMQRKEHSLLQHLSLLKINGLNNYHQVYMRYIKETSQPCDQNNALVYLKETASS